MVSAETQQEIEESLGQVPSWMGHIAPEAAEHSWGMFRDLSMGESELSPREKALIGVGVAATIKCPYCAHFHREEARLADVSEAELEEAVTLAGTTPYFSSVLHGNEVDLEDFKAETAEIVAHIKEQEAPAAGAD